MVMVTVMTSKLFSLDVGLLLGIGSIHTSHGSWLVVGGAVILSSTFGAAAFLLAAFLLATFLLAAVMMAAFLLAAVMMAAFLLAAVMMAAFLMALGTFSGLRCGPIVFA